MSSINDLIGETTTVGLDEITAGNKNVSDLPPSVPNIVSIFFPLVVTIVSFCNGQNERYGVKRGVWDTGCGIRGRWKMRGRRWKMRG